VDELRDADALLLPATRKKEAVVVDDAHPLPPVSHETFLSDAPSDDRLVDRCDEYWSEQPGVRSRASGCVRRDVLDSSDEEIRSCWNGENRT